MRIDRDILDLLACLACGGELQAIAHRGIEPDGHVMEGVLQCVSCQATYPIRRGVPRFVTTPASEEVQATIRTFGMQWVHASRIALSERFGAAETFLDFIAPVDAGHFAGKHVLDAGCGMGRFTRHAAKFGGALVVGVDLSDAVDPAFNATRDMPNAVIVQADLYALPFRPIFDYIFSIGVLHHTIDPDAAFQAVASRLSPSGTMSAWVYGREGNEMLLRALNPVRRITSHLPSAALLALSYCAALPLYAVTKGIYRPLSKGPFAFIGRRLFYAPYMLFLSTFGYRDQVIVIFDHASPQLAQYIDEARFRQWFDHGGLTDVVITRRGGNSWRGFGSRRKTLAPEYGGRL